ncbi:unnamed protein product [Soboliphyme baturini]|uniref:Neur_chan_LBD domain-containing protein n=1 Tax=Soboliphyme baturini TaxID=241478 RepID=A0A183J8N7_9BILA|nr:unnamed protein product [Soboliphyme baturini]
MRHWNFWLCFFGNISVAWLNCLCKSCSNDSWIVDEMLRVHRKNAVPGGGNVVVSVELWVQEISKINEMQSDFELDVYITEAWNDPSLSFHRFNPCKSNLSLDGGTILPKLWNPNCCFINSKSASIHKSPFTNIFLMIVSLL